MAAGSGKTPTPSPRRAYLACRAGFAGRGNPVARATDRSMLAPDPRCNLGSVLSPRLDEDLGVPLG